MTSSSRISESKKLFRSFKNGDSGALLELLENERPRLYDYLMRMTGQVQKSWDTIEEVYLSLNEGVLTELQSFEDLQILLYSTARKFNADIWNADTSRLENAAIGEELQGQPLNEQGLSTLKAQQDLDRGLRSLRPFDREVAYLRLAVGVALSDIADILSNPLHAVEGAYDAAMTKMESETQLSREDIEEGLHGIPRHPMPQRSSHATVNLSMVMEGIKARPSGVRSIPKFLLLAVIAAVVGVWIVAPEWISSAAEYLRKTIGGEP